MPALRPVTVTLPGAKRTRIAAALKRNPVRSAREIAEATWTSEGYIPRIRHELEAGGEIPVYRGQGIRRAPARGRVTAELRRDPARSNRQIAATARADNALVFRIRRELEDAGEISPYRAPDGVRCDRELAARARALLTEDAGRSNEVIAALAGGSRGTARRVRMAMEAGGEIHVYRWQLHQPACWCGAQ